MPFSEKLVTNIARIVNAVQAILWLSVTSPPSHNQSFSICQEKSTVSLSQKITEPTWQGLGWDRRVRIQLSWCILGWILFGRISIFGKKYLWSGFPWLIRYHLHETTLKNHGNQPKTIENHETTLKNHWNKPKTMKNHETMLKMPKTDTLDALDDAMTTILITNLNILWTHSDHTPNILWTYSEHTLTYSEHTLNILKTYFEHTKNILWTYSEHTLNLLWANPTYSEHTRNIIWTYSEPTLNILWT